MMLNNKIIKKIVIFLILLISNYAIAQSSKIRDIKAYLFQQHSGKFTPPISQEDVLWNVIAGEEGVSEPIRSAFLDVIIVGQSNSAGNNQKIELVVKNDNTKKIRYRFFMKVGSFGANAEAHVGFWLPSVGCEPLSVKATISKASKSINLPFKCGE